MRFKLMYPAIILSTVMIFAACNAIDTAANSGVERASNTATGPETTYSDGVRRVTTTELETLMKEGKVFVVDVRTQASYDAGHIPGAKLIPVGDVANRIDEFPRDTLIVTYCS